MRETFNLFTCCSPPSLDSGDGIMACHVLQTSFPTRALQTGKFQTIGERPRLDNEVECVDKFICLIFVRHAIFEIPLEAMGSWGPFPKRGRREWLRSKFSAPSSQFPVPSSQFPGGRLNTFDAGRGPLTGALHHNDESLINTKRGYVHAGRGRLKQVQCDPKGKGFWAGLSAGGALFGSGAWSLNSLILL